MNTPRVLLVEPCNFENSPVGGQLSFAKQLMSTAAAGQYALGSLAYDLGRI